MNNPAVYTNLESLFLFQLLPKHGFLNGAFGRISDELRNTPLIKEQASYDATRLSPEALQELALRLLRDEQKREAENVEKNAAGLSPNSKKRKLASPPLPSLEDAHKHVDKLPILVDRLYARYREEIVKEIRDDETQIENLQREIRDLETAQQTEATPLQPTTAPAVNGPSAAAPAGGPQLLQPNGQPVPSKAAHSQPVPVAKLQEAQISKGTNSSPAPTPIVPILPESVQNSPSRPSPAPPQGAVRPPPPVPDVSKQPATTRPSPSASAPVLQHPQTVQAQAQDARPSPTPSKSPLSDTSAAPNAPPVTKSPAPGPTPTQPGQPTQAQGQVPGQTPAQGQGQGQGQNQSQLQWEPPYQPPAQTPIPSPQPPHPTAAAKPTGHPPVLAANRGQTTVQRPISGQQPRPMTPANAQQGAPAGVPPRAATQTPPVPQHSGPQLVPADAAGKAPLQQRPQTGPVNARPVAPGQTPTRYVPPHGANVGVQTPVRPPAPPNLQVGHAQAGVGRGAHTPILQRPQPGRPHPALQPQAPSTPQQHQGHYPHGKAAVKASYGSPYNQQIQVIGGPGPAQHSGVATPHQQQMMGSISRTPSVPRTPGGTIVPAHVIRGHGTKWVTTPTPATPRMEDLKSYFDVASPAFEPLSPPLPKAQLAKLQPQSQPATPAPSQSRSAPAAASERKPKESEPSSQKDEPAPAAPKGRGRPPRHSTSKATPQPVAPSADIPTENPEAESRKIKTEAATPRNLEEVEETTTSQPVQQTPSAKSTNKRKREESAPTDSQLQVGPATQVLWTRSFHKVSASALEQVISHRHANMFAHAVKERDAPGYRNIVLRPQDLMGIKRAINQGSRAANLAAQSLPDFDPSTSPMNIWLPISADLVPPRGIVNIAQLERELVHMFANAIMYAPDPDRGFGPAFKRRRRDGSEDSSEDALGYEVDEDGIVKDTRSMFNEVEKLLSDLRSELDRNAPPPAGGGSGHSRSMSLAAGAEAATPAEDEAEEQPGDAKRRRVRG